MMDIEKLISKSTVDYSRATASGTANAALQQKQTLDLLNSGNRQSGPNCTSHTTALDANQSNRLQEFTKKKVRPREDEIKAAKHGHAHGHGHAEKPSKIITATVSAVINFLLMFGLCCAYGMIMFGDEWNAAHQALGVKMNLSTAMLMGVSLAVFSKVPVAIGGPDLNPVVFLGMFVDEISKDIASQHGLDIPTRRLEEICPFMNNDNEEPLDERALLSGRWTDDDADSRRLGGSCKKKGGKKKEFCTGSHLANNGLECGLYHKELRATTIFSVAVSTASLSIIFLLLGRMKLTRYVSYMPTNIMEAFLSCVGYKVFKYALTFCLYDTRQFIPAAIVGVVLYFFKALHIGNPAIVIPAFLFIPLGFFYLVIWLKYDRESTFIDQARKDCLFFPKMEDVEFYKIWSDSIGSSSHINFKAWTKSVPDLIIMIIVCVLDCLLKLSSTESKLPVKADKDYEIQLYGAGNLLVTLFGSSVGYMQLKFNVINYGIINNVRDRRAGIIYALLCGVCFFWSIELINYLPRFFLGVLLFFAGAGFVAENLWGSRKYLSLQEWFQILIIIGVFIIFGSLLYAVIVGGLITGVAFIVKYAKVPCIAGKPMHGGEIYTYQRYDAFTHRAVSHVANSWLLVIRLKGFIFFASAQSMTKFILKAIERQVEGDVADFKRVRYIIFDCELLDGMDASASKTIQKCVVQLNKWDVRILWSNIGTLVNDLKTHGTLSSDYDVFDDLQHSVLYVQDMIVQRLKMLQERWCLIHPSLRCYHDIQRIRMQFEPFGECLSSDASRLGCPWDYCGRLKIERFKTVLWQQNDMGKDLYLVHSGAVGLFRDLPGPKKQWTTPVAYHRRGSLLNVQSLIHAPSKHNAVATEDGEVLFWNELQWWRMSRERPFMASAIMKMAMEQETETESEMEGVVDGILSQMQDDQAGDEGKDIDDAEDIEEAKNASLPQSLQLHLGGMLAAHVIARWGLYDKLDESDAGFLPALPASVDNEFQVAFHTFCEADMKTGRDILQWSNLQAALMYAGLFGTVFADQGAALTKPEFLVFAHEAFYTRFSAAMCEKLGNCFDVFVTEDDEGVDVQELCVMVKAIFHPNISVEAVSGTAVLWMPYDGASKGKMFRDQFIAFMARFARQHEQDWYVLQACSELVGHEVLRNLTPNENVDDNLDAFQQLKGKKCMSFIPTATNEDRVSLDTLTTALQKVDPLLTRTDAEEMFWAANSYGGDPQNNTELHFHLIFPILLTVFEASGRLPPLPRKPPRINREALDSIILEMQGQVDLDDLSTKFVGDVDQRKYQRVIQDLRVPCEDLKMPAQTQNEDWLMDCPPSEQLRQGLGSVKTTTSYQQYMAQKESNRAEAEKIPETCQAKVYMVLEEPTSSRCANILSITMGILIILSVMTLVAEPLISPKDGNPSDGEKAVWYAFEVFFTSIFTVEFLIRWAVSDALTQIGFQAYIDFVRAPMNICDIVAVMPFYLDLALDTESESFRLFRVVRLTRLARVMRLGRLSNRNELFAPIAVVLTVIWGIYLKTGMKD